MIRLRIKEIAESKGYSMGKVSRSSDVSLSTIRVAWKNPLYRIKVDTLQKIARGLGVTIGDLFEVIPENQPGD